MLEKLLESEQIRKAQHALQQGDSLLVEGLWNTSKAVLTALAQQTTGKQILILTGASQEEMRLYHDFSFFTDRPIAEFPAWETLPSENIAPSPDVVGERYSTLKNVSSNNEPYIVLSGLQACLQKILPPDRLDDLYLSLKVGDTITREELLEHLNAMGYQKTSVAADKGEFSVRGGIIDVYPVSSPDPFRLEFFGDDIESIRVYDPIGQRSVRQVEVVKITPAQELELIGQENKLCSLLDYLGPNTLVIFDDIAALEDRYASLVNICGKSTPYFSSLDELLDQIAPLQKIYLSQQKIEELTEVRLLESSNVNYYSSKAPLYSIEFEMFRRQLRAKRWQHPFVSVGDFLLPNREDFSGQELLKGLSLYSKSSLSLYFLCSSDLEEENLQRKIAEENIELPKDSHYVMGYLSSGIAIQESNILLLPMTEITGRYKIRRQKQRSNYHSVPTETFDLLPDDLVVHFNHGIGKYVGLEKKPDNTGVVSEFLVLQYAEGAKIYVPLSQAHLVTKYIAGNDDILPLHTIGSSKWQKTREKTQVAIEGYANDLLELYAKRQMTGGYACKPDSPDFQDFEEDFLYVETEDQLAAISAIKNDMVSDKCMDRLICGDVGYGKTEVAMRAAFKAVVDGGKQVAILVPTTVLATQHYENFLERMCNFPLSIGILSRFRTQKQIRETIAGIKDGTIDIAIGTHRLVSNDIIFKDLGLVIIDEEQRFGVKAKEHLKKIKAGVDCLTLSATPIPRTLYMSLIGARDISIINTPPQDRLPITTIVTNTSEDVFKSAIARELARDGQVYVIHNRVETIYEISDRIKKWFPHANVAVCHGQLDNHTIDKVFHGFKSGVTNILVATTIVESGIDIPNANTILIDKADHFGLADLYQLRGRVGRWNRRAYAYLLVRNLTSLPEIARKRLNALAESSGYGGGMKVARRDLEIRGAGNILGTEQSGQVAALGFDLYYKLLKRTVQRLQGKISTFFTDIKVEFPVGARLPEEYIDDTNLRIEICQRFGEAFTEEEVDSLWVEIKDRFGPPPLSAAWFYHLIRIKVFAAQKNYTLVKFEKKVLTVQRKLGKHTITQKIPMLLPKTPKELEDKIVKLLQD